MHELLKFVGGLILGAAAVALVLGLLGAAGVPWSCDPPRHVVKVATLDGMGRTECDETVTLPNGQQAIVVATPTPSRSR